MCFSFLSITDSLFLRASTLLAGKLELPHVMAGAKERISLPEAIFSQHSEHELHLTVSLQLNQPTSWADKGHEVAWFQYRLSAARLPRYKPPEVSLMPNIENSGTGMIITTAESVFTFDRSRGLLRSWVASDGPVVTPSSSTGSAPAMIPAFWRTPTDNDMPAALPHWRLFGVDRITSQLRALDLHQDPSSHVITLTTQTYLGPAALGWGFHARTTYQIQPDGSAMSIVIDLEAPVGHAPKNLPRAGFDLSLAPRLNHVKWFGLGPGESYPDKKSSQRVGIWEVDDVAQLQTPYDVPQENGNRMHTRWLDLSSKPGGPGLRVSRIEARPSGLVEGAEQRHHLQGREEFSFTATRHLPHTLERAAHPCDLVEEKHATLLRLDAAVSGVGTGACGPGVREDLTVKPVAMRFGFLLEVSG